MDMKQLRERIGLSTVDVAYRLGKSESTIRNWDTGRQIPTLEVIEVPVLLEVYQCSLEELVAAVKESRAKYKTAKAD